MNKESNGGNKNNIATKQEHLKRVVKKKMCFKYLWFISRKLSPRENSKVKRCSLNITKNKIVPQNAEYENIHLEHA